MTNRDRIFSPLDIPTSEIRLLDLLPSQIFEAKIYCRPRVVSLNTAPIFDALSWCWGSISEKVTIELNDQPFECTKNLESALRHFRDSHAVTTLWVDATCINQQDLDERSKQVLLMRRIYRQADTVRIWLGDSADDSDLAIRVMEQLQQDPHFGHFQLDGRSFTERQIDAFCALLTRPWWSRVWVMQEFALARQATFHCGRASFKADGLSGTIIGLGSTIDESFTIWTSEGRYDARARALGLRVASSLCETFPLGDLIEYIKKIDRGDNPQRYTVEAIMSLTPLKSTDPRDKVFGCIGVLPGLLDHIIPDYSQSVEVVYSNATWGLICYHQSLFALCFLRPHVQKTETPHGEGFLNPSWSLNFAEHRDITKTHNLFTLFPKCSPWGEFTTRIHQSFLETSGVFFDEIVRCHPMEPDWQSDRSGNAKHVENLRFLHGRWRDFFNMELDQSNHSSYIGGGSIEHAYWSLVSCGFFSVEHASFERLNTTTINAVVNWIRNLNSNELHPSQPDWDTNQAAHGHRLAGYSMSFKNNTYLFVTRRGYIGMSTGDPDIAVGHHLYFLERGQVPWALEPIEDGSGQGVFQLKCQCYVHGIMDGEAFQPVPKVGSKAWERHGLRRKIFGGSMLDERLPVRMPPWDRILLA